MVIAIGFFSNHAQDSDSIRRFGASSPIENCSAGWLSETTVAHAHRPDRAHALDVPDEKVRLQGRLQRHYLS
jgi:hypothetical protein